jgi:Tfp pilus assembly PilM family ATPase
MRQAMLKISLLPHQVPDRYWNRSSLPGIYIESTTISVPHPSSIYLYREALLGKYQVTRLHLHISRKAANLWLSKQMNDYTC